MNYALCVSLASCNTAALLTRAVRRRLEFKGSKGKPKCLLGIDVALTMTAGTSHTCVHTE